MTDNVHFSSERDDWATPKSLVTFMSRYYYATIKHEVFLDVCGTATNAKAEHYISLENGDDALDPILRWDIIMENINDLHAARGDGAEGMSRAMAWMNPPYGRGIGEWVQKAYETGRAGHPVLALLPSRTDTAWWHDYVLKAYEVWTFRGRLYFDGHVNAAPFPSAMAMFYGELDDPAFKTINANQFKRVLPITYGLRKIRTRRTQQVQSDDYQESRRRVVRVQRERGA